jgi:phenylacetate-CoA ligase
MTASRLGELDTLSIEIEDTQNDPQRVEQLIELRLGLHVDVTCVASQSLPRFEAKGKRFIDLRS